MADTPIKTTDQATQPPDAVETGLRPQRVHFLLRLARFACLVIYELFLGSFLAVPHFWRIRRRAVRILRYQRDLGGDPDEEALLQRWKRSAEWGLVFGLVGTASAVVSLVSGLVWLCSSLMKTQ